MVGSFLLHAAMSGGRGRPMLQGRHPRCHRHFWRTDITSFTCSCSRQGLACHGVVHWARLYAKQYLLRISLRCSTSCQTLAAAFLLLFCHFTPDSASRSLNNLPKASLLIQHRPPLSTIPHWPCRSCSTCRKQQLGTCAGGIHCFGGARYALWVLQMARAALETAPSPAVKSYGMC